MAAAASALAYPDASPWGAANPVAAENCASCHYDYEPVADSRLLELAGLPEQLTAGQRYELRIDFAAADALPEATASGFQLIVSSGHLESPDPETETGGTALRSTAVREAKSNVTWPLVWRAPVEPSTVTFYAAASAANHDNSPFGDVIHYRRYDRQVVIANDAADDPKKEVP